MKAFLIGLQFLTRIHLAPQSVWKDEDFGRSVTWFPVIGMVIGVFLCVLYFLLWPFDLPLLIAFLLVVGEFFITGGIHADGLMDSADGLFSGRTKERSLEIMKDSLVGSFGLMAFVFLVLLKTFCLYSVDDRPLYLLLLAMPAVSRFGMVISICEYPYARPFGIGKSFAAYRDKHAVVIAFILALLPALYFRTGWLILMGVGILVTLWLNRWVVSKIGGTTGDTYGFVAEITEVVMALFYVLVIHGDLWLETMEEIVTAWKIFFLR